MWYEPGDSRLVRYLLGGLTEPERDQVENEYLADETVHEHLLAIECELIDAYVRSELSPSERQQFESHYLMAQEGRERVARARLAQLHSGHVIRASVPHFEPRAADPGKHQLARSAIVQLQTLCHSGRTHSVQDLNGAVSEGSWLNHLVECFGVQSATARVACAIAALLVVLLPTFLVMRSRYMDGSPKNATRTEETKFARSLPPTKAPIEINPPATQPDHLPQFQPALSFLLAPTARGERDGNTVRVPSGDHSLKLRLVLQDDRYQLYGATVKTAEDRIVASWDRLPVVRDPRLGAIVEISLLSSRVPPASYTVQLTGTNQGGNPEQAGGYIFTVARGVSEPEKQPIEVAQPLQPTLGPTVSPEGPKRPIRTPERVATPAASPCPAEDKLSETEPLPAYTGPSRVYLSWNTSYALQPGCSLVLAGRLTSEGSISGMPFIPRMSAVVTVFEPQGIAVMEQPNKANRFRIVLRNTTTSAVPWISLRWEQAVSATPATSPPCPAEDTLPAATPPRAYSGAPSISIVWKTDSVLPSGCRLVLQGRAASIGGIAIMPLTAGAAVTLAVIPAIGGAVTVVSSSSITGGIQVIEQPSGASIAVIEQPNEANRYRIVLRNMSTRGVKFINLRWDQVR